MQGLLIGGVGCHTTHPRWWSHVAAVEVGGEEQRRNEVLCIVRKGVVASSEWQLFLLLYSYGYKDLKSKQARGDPPSSECWQL